MYEFTPKSQH